MFVSDWSVAAQKAMLSANNSPSQHLARLVRQSACKYFKEHQLIPCTLPILVRAAQLARDADQGSVRSYDWCLRELQPVQQDVDDAMEFLSGQGVGVLQSAMIQAPSKDAPTAEIAHLRCHMNQLEAMDVGHEKVRRDLPTLLCVHLAVFPVQRGQALFVRRLQTELIHSKNTVDIKGFGRRPPLCTPTDPLPR
jgi:hypothetical protein